MEANRLRLLLTFLIEGAFGLFLVLAPIRWMDRRGLFDIVEDDHIRERWASIDAMSGKFPVDVLILGNSHAYTGVHPGWLSAATGMTCFILANQGVNVVDSYWGLREALNSMDPQIVLIETTGMNDRPMIADSPSGLVNQLRAVHARKDSWEKVQSLPELFERDDYPQALSTTVMNHHLWWTDPEMVKENTLRGEPFRPQLDGLFLGQHIRFFTGIEDTTLTQYRERGGILDGAKVPVCEKNREAAQRIIDLGKERGFQVGFFTLPMHVDFLSHPEARKAHLQEAIGPMGVPWLNLQDSAALAADPRLFENTLGENQHLTLRGAMRVNQPLADWMEVSFSGVRRPGRERDLLWHNVMQREHGYLAYFDPMLKENAAMQFSKRDVPLDGEVLPWFVVFQPNDSREEFLTVHARPMQSWLPGGAPGDWELLADVVVELKSGERRAGSLTLKWEPAVNDGERWLYRTAMKKVTLIDVKRLRWRRREG